MKVIKNQSTWFENHKIIFLPHSSRLMCHSHRYKSFSICLMRHTRSRFVSYTFTVNLNDLINFPQTADKHIRRRKWRITFTLNIYFIFFCFRKLFFNRFFIVYQFHFPGDFYLFHFVSLHYSRAYNTRYYI